MIAHLVSWQQALIDLTDGLVGGSLLDDSARKLQVVVYEDGHSMVQLLDTPQKPHQKGTQKTL